MLLYCDRPSQSAVALCRALGIRRLRNTGKMYDGSVPVINWGSGVSIFRASTHVLNPPETVSRVSNKLRFFELIDGHPYCPEFTVSQGLAQDWANNAHRVVVRHTLRGHSGHGVEIVEPGGEVPLAPLYTKYRSKREEYRIHVGNLDGIAVNVFDRQRKARLMSVPNEEVNWQVRNLKGGFIYARNNIADAPGLQACTEAAIQAARLTGLHFGAYDVVWHPSHPPLVLEVNTAPGLVGTTLDNYVTFFKGV